MDHDCDKTELLASIKRDVEHFYKALHGNGQPGLIQGITELSTNVKSLNESIPKMRDQIDQLIIYKIGNEAVKNNKMETIKNFGMFAGLAISIVLGFFSLRQSEAQSVKSENTIVTNSATLESAIRAGKDIRLRGGDVLKQYEDSMNAEIKSINR